jgi:hypothetical protein
MTDTVQSQAATASSRGDFLDPTTLLRVVTGFLIAYIAATLLALVFRGLEYRMLVQFASGLIPSADVAAEAKASDAIVELTGGLRALVFFVTLIPFGMWIYRANRNARTLGAVGMKHSPGWSVGSYFVPIVNLFVPFLSMREIWRASLNPGNPESAPTTPLLGWWWFLWLGHNVSGWIAALMLKSIHTLDMALDASLVAAAQNVFGIAVAVVALLLVRRITENQLMQSRLVEVF